MRLGVGCHRMLRDKLPNFRVPPPEFAGHLPRSGPERPNSISFRVVRYSDGSGRCRASNMSQSLHAITSYSGNSICPYSFQIPSLQ
jgi:hypothetical protein